MEPVQTDQILYCTNCGVELKVIKSCDSGCVCNIVCCGETMKERGKGEAAGDSPGCCGS